MKLVLNANLTGFDGREIITAPEDTTPVTVRKALELACISADPQKYVTGEQKYTIYEMLKRLNGVDSIELSAEDIVLLKELIGFAYGPAVVGAVYDLLDPPVTKH